MLKIYKGDDTGGRFGTNLSVTMTSQRSLTGCKVVFELYGVKKEFSNVTSGATLGIAFTAAETTQFPFGIGMASIYTLDADDRRRTFVNALPVRVTDCIEECYGDSSSGVTIKTSDGYLTITNVKDANFGEVTTGSGTLREANKAIGDLVTKLTSLGATGNSVSADDSSSDTPSSTAAVSINNGFATTSDVNALNFAEVDVGGGTQREANVAINKIASKLTNLKPCLMAAAIVSALLSFGEVTRDTEWQDVPPTTKIGTVVDLGQGGGGVNTNAVIDIAKYTVSTATVATIDGRGYVTQSITNDLASTNWVYRQNYLSSAILSGYATMQWVSNQNYAAESITNSLASTNWVAAQGYVCSAITNGLATTNWVSGRGFLLSESDPLIGLTNGIIWIHGDTIEPITNHQSLAEYATTGSVHVAITNTVADWAMSGQPKPIGSITNVFVDGESVVTDGSANISISGKRNYTDYTAGTGDMLAKTSEVAVAVHNAVTNHNADTSAHSSLFAEKLGKHGDTATRASGATAGVAYTLAGGADGDSGNNGGAGAKLTLNGGGAGIDDADGGTGAVLNINGGGGGHNGGAGAVITLGGGGNSGSDLYGGMGATLTLGGGGTGESGGAGATLTLNGGGSGGWDGGAGAKLTLGSGGSSDLQAGVGAELKIGGHGAGYDDEGVAYSANGSLTITHTGSASETLTQRIVRDAESLTNNLASTDWVTTRGYITSSALSGYATEQWVENKNYVTKAITNGLASEAWVEAKAYVTDSVTNGLASESWVNGRGYAYETNLQAVSNTVSDIQDNTNITLTVASKTLTIRNCGTNIWSSTESSATERRIAMFIIPVNDNYSPSGTPWHGFELKSDDNNYAADNIKFWAQSDLGSAGSGTTVDGIRMYVVQTNRVYHAISSTVSSDTYAQIVVLVNADLLKRTTGEWLNETNDDMAWIYVRTDGSDGYESHTGSTTSIGSNVLWRPIQPVRWFYNMPAWAE